MTTPDYKEKMSDLRTQVEKYSKSQTKSNDKQIIEFTPKKYTQYIFYTVIPVITIVLLFFVKPDFICNITTEINNVVTKKINFKKLFIIGFISGGIISGGLFIYFKQKNINII
jgi:Mn2+/Fe2+ NRAMP family transporter